MHCEAIHCPDTETVRFAIYPDGFDGPRIIAHVSEDALHDLFGATDDEESLVGTCDDYFDVIEAKALARYRAAPFLPVTLHTAEFPFPFRCRNALRVAIGCRVRSKLRHSTDAIKPHLRRARAGILERGCEIPALVDRATDPCAVHSRLAGHKLAPFADEARSLRLAQVDRHAGSGCLL